ncbi:MAG: alpha/beta hydrolase [Gemmatirosa sp.]|nr:alpha/beta hydrolase [Gemmatirosa sp.]
MPTRLPLRRAPLLAPLLAPLAILLTAAAQPAPTPPGRMVDIGGQRLHLHCTGSGTPTVVFESGTGDVSAIWSLVQPRVSAFTRACSYDRGGYAWSDPGARPRTYAQLSLELRTALDRAGVAPPYVLVGQSYGGLVVRGFADRYRADVAGMVLVDAVHEDQHVVYGGQPHRIRDEARGRPFPAPHVALDTAAVREAAAHPSALVTGPLDPPLDRLPSDAQRIWRWAAARPSMERAQGAEIDWSPEELARFHDARRTNRATLGALPLVVLARARGGYASGMRLTADSLERERRALMADLARLSTTGRLVFARTAGHNIHVEDPTLVVDAIRDVVIQARRGRTR